jgi:pimeloyl-ACP methyl ester carboxylesterase
MAANQPWRDSSLAPVGPGMLDVRGLPIDYEVLGRTGAGQLPLVLTPGGGGGKGGFRSLAQRFKNGRQCLLWDSPNTGASGYTLGEDERQPEFDMQADYLHYTLHQLGMAPAILLGKSNGARLSLVMAAKYPQDVAGLVLLNVTNGSKAAKHLSKERYFKHLDAVASGAGMAAVAHHPHFVSLFEKNPGNKERLLSNSADRFMLQMKIWGDSLAKAGDSSAFPVTALSRQLLQTIQQPALCVYIQDPSGDDGMHTLSAMQALHAELPGARARPVVVTDDKEVYCSAIEEWMATVPLPTTVPESPSAAAAAAPLRVRDGMYPQLPSPQELQQLRSFYANLASENADEAANERKALCSFGGIFDGLYTWKQPKQR